MAFITDKLFPAVLASREKAMFSYQNLVKYLSLPVSHVFNLMIRAFSKFDDIFYLAYFKEMLFKLIELVYNLIRKDLYNHHGATVHDACSRNGSHIFGVFASYVNKVPVVGIEKELFQEECSMLPFTFSPMSQVRIEEEEKDGLVEMEASKFDSELMLVTWKMCSTSTAVTLINGLYVPMLTTATSTSVLFVT